MRALLIGAGGIGACYPDGPGGTPRNHAAALAAGEDVIFVGAVDTSEAARETFRRDWDRPAWDPASARSRVDGVDVAVVATPPEAHRTGVALALDLGARAILCEKPFGKTREDAVAIAAMAERGGAHVVVNYSRRFDPGILQIVRRVTGGIIGDIRRVSIDYCRGLRNNGSHAIDLALALVGSITVDQAQDRLHEAGDDPTLDAWLTGGGGVAVDLVAHPQGDYHTFSTEIVGASGVIRIDSREATLRRGRRDPLMPLSPPEPMVANIGDGALTGAIDDLLAVARGRRPRCDAAHALAVWKIIDDLCRSSSRTALSV